MHLDVVLNQFRIASRELFNHYFHLPGANVDDAWRMVERFQEVEELLFQKLVLEPAGLPRARYGDPQAEISVSLRDQIDSSNMMLNREVDSGYWDHPLSRIDRSAQLIFVRFFDWDRLGICDNELVRVKVMGWPGHEELVGKHALVQAYNVQFAQAKRT